MSTSSTLAQHADIIPTRSRLLHPIPCPPADPSPLDRHSQSARGPYPCRSSTGRRRRRHEFIVETRQGTRCLWCWRLRAWEPL